VAVVVAEEVEIAEVSVVVVVAMEEEEGVEEAVRA
jgi:hypothetical protein